MVAGRFLNVDLEIESRADLASLAAELEPRAYVLHSGPLGDGHLMCLEPDGCPEDKSDADDTIHEFCRLVETLSPTGRELWEQAARREFDVGFDATTEHLAAHFALRTDTLARITGLRATLAVSVYRAESA